jgi:hypothetical protein
VLLIVDDGCKKDTCRAEITVDCPVPVRLAAFSVARSGQGAVLSWEVAEATDHQGFEVHREAAGSARERISGLLTGGPDFEFVDRGAPAGRVDYWLAELSRSGGVSWHGPVTLEPAAATPAVLTLGAARPNPFAAETRIAYGLPETGFVRVSVYDTQGRMVRRLFEGTRDAGSHEAVWDGKRDDGSRSAVGFYIVRLEAAGTTRSQKIVLSR